MDGDTSTASAVILFGLVHRSLRHVVESLQRRVLAPLAALGDVDVFFHSWDVRQIVNPRAGELDVAVSPEDVARLLPGARGVIESQDAFDAEVDWAPMFARNPMWHCSRDETSARTTLMNFRRALESAERAWGVFEARRERRYRRVVVARPDLRFLDDLAIPPELQGPGPNERGGRTLWLPRHHAWGGVNDRFAIGSEDAIGVWCRRTAFADGWLLGADNQNSEWLLMKWLARNRVEVRLVDLLFQRVRSDGSVARLDAALAPVGSARCD